MEKIQKLEGQPGYKTKFDRAGALFFAEVSA
jgi:hypothetical protein